MVKKLLLLTLVVLFGAALPASSQTSETVKSNLNQTEIDGIVRKFTENEARFRGALELYSFKRSATFQTIGMGGQVSGTYRRDSYMTFKEDGTRFEKILFFPVSTITEIQITIADIENLGGIDPFAIEPSAIGKYNFTYVGKEKIDELNLHVFDVAPKIMPEAKKGVQRLFSGRIWVDDEDFFIVKSKGKAVPEGKERFPTVETWRENVDLKYWFPSYSTADDELVFDNGYVARIRVRVKYSGYTRGKTDVKIIDEEEETPTPSPSPTPKKP